MYTEKSSVKHMPKGFIISIAIITQLHIFSDKSIRHRNHTAIKIELLNRLERIFDLLQVPILLIKGNTIRLLQYRVALHSTIRLT